MSNKYDNLNDNELIYEYGTLIKELKSRRIIRSKNILGDLGEYIVINHYNNTPGLPNLQSAPIGTENVDALSRKGERYSIKSTTTTTTGVFYGLPTPDSKEIIQQKFEYVIIAIFDNNYSLVRINELSWDNFLKLKRWHSRMKAWNLQITQNLFSNSKTIIQID